MAEKYVDSSGVSHDDHHDMVSANNQLEATGHWSTQKGGGRRDELSDMGAGALMVFVFWTFLLPIKIGGWIAKIFLYFTGIIGRIWQTILFSLAVSFVFTLLIMYGSGAASGVSLGGIVDTVTDFAAFNFNPEHRLWYFVFWGIAAVFGAVYFFWHYRAVRCAQSDFFFIVQIMFCIMVYGGVITSIILGAVFDVVSNFWNWLIPLILATGFYVVCMIGPMKEAARLKKDGEPLPGDMSISQSIDGIIFNGYTIRKVKTVLITFIVLAPSFYMFVYFLHQDILRPLGIASGNFGSASLAILTSFILLSIPMAFFCHWYYVENGDAESFDEETGAYDGETRSKGKVIFFVITTVLVLGAFYALSFNRAFFNELLGINKLTDSGPIQISSGKGFLQQILEKVMGDANLIQLGSTEIILLSLVVAVPVLFLLATRFRWKIAFLLLFAITIFGITLFVRTQFLDTPAFPNSIYNMFNLPAVKHKIL